MIKIYQIPMETKLNFMNTNPEFYVPLSLGDHQVTEEEINKYYKEVWQGEVETDNLEEIFRIFNLDHPSDYHAPSLSCGDVVETSQGKFACMSIGWKPVLKA